MAMNIMKLLHKKSWSGEEVGKALLSSIIYDINHGNEPNFSPLFSQADFEKMENSLKTEQERSIYSVYKNIYQALIDSYNRGQGLYQQFWHGYYRYKNTLELCRKTDRMIKHTQNLPLVISRTQYDRLKIKAQNALKNQKNAQKEPKEQDIIDQFIAEIALKNPKIADYMAFNGVAILQDAKPDLLDEDGKYIQESIFDLESTLDNLFADGKTKAELTMLGDKFFKPAMRYFYAFNALMSIIGDIYGIENLETVNLNTENLELQLKNLNRAIYGFYKDVAGNSAQKERKRAMIKELFNPVDIEELKPKKAAIAQVKQKILELGFTLEARQKLKSFDYFISLLICGEA